MSDLATYQSLLTAYQSALTKIALGQSYEVGGRRLSRANLQEVRDTIDWLEAKIRRLSDATGGVGLATFGEAQ